MRLKGARAVGRKRYILTKIEDAGNNMIDVQPGTMRFEMGFRRLPWWIWWWIQYG